MLKKILIPIIFIFFPFFGHAQGVTLSIAPPLIKNNVNPGQVWKSVLKVVNNNSTDVEVYTQVLDFKSGDNGNTVEFLPALSDKEKEDKVRLSSWIVMEDKKIIIPAFKSVDVSFIIDVPKEAEPGGHYAAILVGTTPPKEKIDGSAVKVSSMLSSLILLSVDGDIKEDGRIREFSTDKSFYFKPEVNFKVKFENLGNVHIQPQGEIKITDLFGKTKEVITLNHKSEFGNVLPANSRVWDFSWKGDGSLTEMGRYKAQLVVSYGNKERETIDQSLFFWVIYLKPLLIMGGSLLFIFLLLFFSIRAYIKKSIRSAQIASGIIVKDKKISKDSSPIVKKKSSETESSVNKEKVINLKASSGADALVDDKIMKNVKRSGYKKFMIFVLVILLLAAGVFVYLYYSEKEGQALNYNEIYQANKEMEKNNNKDDVVNNDVEIASSSGETEEIEVLKSDEVSNASSSKVTTSTSEVVDDEASSTTDKAEVFDEIIPKANGELLIKILNGGGVSGMANKVVDLIAEEKYKPAQVGNADNYDYETTLIRYKKGDIDYANEIKSLIDRKAIVEEASGQEEDIVIIIGKSFVPSE